MNATENLSAGKQLKNRLGANKQVEKPATRFWLGKTKLQHGLTRKAYKVFLVIDTTTEAPLKVPIGGVESCGIAD